MCKKILTSLCMSCLLMICSTEPSHAVTDGSDIYFVRHAETMGNLTHHHTHKNDRTLSPEGRRQVAALTRRLDRLQFDHIIVSPKLRAMKTILPYLKKHRLVAEIWPELAECCWQKRHEHFYSNPQRGGAIRLAPELRRYFTFADADAHYLFNTHGYGEGMAQTLMAVRKIRQRFSGTGQRILIVGHYHSGSRIIEILQGLEPTGRYHIANTQILHLRESSDGAYALRR